MRIELKPEHAQVVNEALQSGAYSHPDDVIARALEVLREEEGWLHDQRDRVSEKIDRAFGQFERGEFLTAEESRADMEQRKAAWIKNRQG